MSPRKVVETATGKLVAGHPKMLLRSHWTSRWSGGVFLILLVLMTSPMGLLSLVPDEYRRPATSPFPSQATSSGIADIQVGQSAEISDPLVLTQALALRDVAGRILCRRGWTGHVISIAATLLTSLVIWRVGLAMFAPPVGWLAAWLVSLSPMAALESGRAASSPAWAFMVLAFAVAWRGTRPNSSVPHAGPAATGSWPAGDRFRRVNMLLLTGILVFLAVAIKITSCEHQGIGSDRMASPHPPGFLTAFRAPLPLLLQTLLVPILLWPASLGLGPGMVLAFRRSFPRFRRRVGTANHPSVGDTSNAQRRGLGRPADSFCLIWIFAGWLLAECFSHRVPNGSALMHPPLALLCVRGVYSLRRAWEPVVRSAVGRSTVVGSIFLGEAMAIGVPLAVAFMGRMKLTTASVAVPAGLLVVIQVFLWFGALALRRRDFPKALIVLSLCAAMSNMALFGFILPQLE